MVLFKYNMFKNTTMLDNLNLVKLFVEMVQCQQAPPVYQYYNE